MTFRPPVRDLAFSLRHVAGFERLADAFPEADADTVGAVLEAAGAFAGDILAPLNRAGDLVGAKLENGVVRTAPGFADAYQQFAQGGWTSLAAPVAHGGQGLPKTLEVAVLEMIQAARAFLDVVEEVVADRDKVADVVAGLGSLAEAAGRAARAGEPSSPSASDDRVQHIRVS